MDEVGDWDAATIQGEQASVTIGQAKPKATAKKWQYSATTAYVNVISFQADPHSGVATAELEITPIAADGSTAPWTFDSDASNA